MVMSANRRARPSVFGTAGQAWRSAWLAIIRMPLLMLAATSVLLAFNVCAGLGFRAIGQPHTASHVALSALDGVVASLSMAPVAISVHRFVLLGERTRLWPRVPMRVVLCYAGWSIAFSVAYSVVGVVGLAKHLPLPGMAVAASAVQVLLFVVYTRLVLMLPAIAMQSTQPLADWSLRQTRHRFWRTVALLFLVEMPLVILGVLIGALAWHLGDLAHLMPMALSLSTPLVVASVVAGAAALSWLFRRYDVAEEPSDLIPAAT